MWRETLGLTSWVSEKEREGEGEGEGEMEREGEREEESRDSLRGYILSPRLERGHCSYILSVEPEGP